MLVQIDLDPEGAWRADLIDAGELVGVAESRPILSGHAKQVQRAAEVQAVFIGPGRMLLPV